MKKVIIKNFRAYLKGERKMVCINGTIHLSEKQLLSAGVKDISHLDGATINVEFYKKDEKLLNEAVCTKDDIIVKNFEVELSEEVKKLNKAVGAGFKAFQL